MPYDTKSIRKGALAGIGDYARKQLGHGLKGIKVSKSSVELEDGKGLGGDTSEKTMDVGPMEIEAGEPQVDVPGSLEKDEAANAAVTKEALHAEPADAQESLAEEPLTRALLEKLLKSLGEG